MAASTLESIHQRRDPLFPALTRVRQIHSSLPFDFPELLLRPERLLKLYRDETLESTDSLFSELNRLIACLEEESEVRAAYTSYIQEVCQAQGKGRWRLLKGEARLILGDDCFLIPRKLGREIFYADHSLSPTNEEAVGSLAVQLIDSSPLIKLENSLINEERMSRTFSLSSPLPKALRGWLDTLLPTIAQEEALKLIDQLCSSSTSIDQLFSDAILDSHLNLAKALAPGAALPSKLSSLLEAVISQGSPEAFSFLADLGAPIESSLHLMAENGRSSLITLLFERLGDRLTLDRRGAVGRTALHIAALHGKIDLVRTLLAVGVNRLLTDNNLETPLSLALKHGADEVARLLLFYPLNPDTPEVHFSETTNRERALQETFIQAFQRGSLQEQVFSLVKQAFIALEGERPDYWKATLLLNSASAIAQKLSPQCEDLLIYQLEQIEHSFIRYELGREIEYRGRVREYRARLRSIREGVARSLEQRFPLPIDLILLELTQSYKEFLSYLLNECIEIIGKAPPTRFAMVGLGSMSRNEMCPYSDIEFIFLVEEDNEETRSYFRSITRLMVLKIANLGETDYELPTFLERGRFVTQSLTPSGFKMDSALSPLGQRGLYQAGAHELIGTPSRLAEFQADDDKGIILLNAMTTSCFIEGDPDLLRDYQREVSGILDATFPSQQKRGEERALELIKWDVIEYAPQLNQEKIESRFFGIKKELYRFPQSLINALAIYHGVRSTNTFQRIDRLQEKGVFSITGANQLKRLFRSTLKMRVQTHLFYENEQEVFYLTTYRF